MIKRLWKMLFNYFYREYWEAEANKLPKNGWRVGRTDMYSYNWNGKYVHYVYPPEGTGGRIAFLGSHTSALRKAVKYAQSKNKQSC